MKKKCVVPWDSVHVTAYCVSSVMISVYGGLQQQRRPRCWKYLTAHLTLILKRMLKFWSRWDLLQGSCSVQWGQGRCMSNYKCITATKCYVLDMCADVHFWASYPFLLTVKFERKNNLQDSQVAGVSTHNKTVTVKLLGINFEDSFISKLNDDKDGLKVVRFFLWWALYRYLNRCREMCFWMNWHSLCV